MQYLRSFLAHFLFALWFGGLTFYAAFVVPIGGALLGETTQGYVTQQVTIRLNTLAVVALIFWAWEMMANLRLRQRGVAIWGFQAIILLGLVMLHVKLSSMLDLEDRSGPISAEFYFWHRLYLIGTTVQWLLGLAMAWELAAGRSTRSTDMAIQRLRETP